MEIMSVNENVAYLKGLAEGLGIDTETKEGKLLTAIIDALDEMAAEINDVEETCDEYGELLDTIDEDLGDLEEDFYGEDDEEEGDLYEVTCPNCGDKIYLDEDTLLEGDMDCPSCGQKLEFDFDGCECDDEECGCCNHEDE